MMKLFTPPNRRPLFGVLESPSFRTPFAWYDGDVAGSCLSYGTDWYLETIPGPETVLKYQHSEAFRLFLDKDGGFVWRFQSEDGFGQFRSLSYAVGDTQSRSLDRTAAPIGKFRIWAHYEDYLDQRARPILSYPSEEATDNGAPQALT